MKSVFAWLVIGGTGLASSVLHAGITLVIEEVSGICMQVL